MFNVTLDAADPKPEELGIVAHELSLVIAAQSRLRQIDLRRKRDLFMASRSERTGRLRRMVDADLTRTEASLLHLVRVEKEARSIAEEQLEPLCRCLHGLVAAYDIGDRTLGVRIGSHGSRHMIRMLLLPEPARRMRVQLQTYGKGSPPTGRNPCRPVCLGHRGDAYTDLALDAMDLPTLVQTLVSYVRTNGSTNEDL